MGNYQVIKGKALKSDLILILKRYSVSPFITAICYEQSLQFIEVIVLWLSSVKQKCDADEQDELFVKTKEI